VTARVTPPPAANADAARRQYVTAAVMTASPEKLVVLLYEGAIQALLRAEHAFGSGQKKIAGPQLAKALSIVGELRASLDFEQGGDVAKSLFSLYGFATDRIIKANVEQAAAPAGEARAVLSKLKEGWDGIVRGS
jgi:flagellar protein FliS